MKSKINNRSFYYAIALVFVIVVIILLSRNNDQESGPSVFLDLKSGGILEGVVLERDDGYVSAFYGIPFASPPLGPLRFKKAVPHSGFEKNQVISARHQVPGCIQHNPWTPVPESEDCLYLTVFVPGKEINPYSKKTVMVWIFGGSFVMGSNRLDISELAAFGDVVVVVMNYRVGIYGFLKSDTKAFETNIGLHDQVLALKWVHDNIESFGGDASQVTIFGESAGAISVGFHLMSNYSKPYFKRAILESGAPSPVGLFGVDLDPLHADDLIRMTNCGKDDDEKKLKCLQDLDIPHLKEAQSKLMIAKNTNAIIPSPDGDFIPKHPFEFFKQDNAFADYHKEIIIGINGDEGAMFISPMLPHLFPNKSNKINQSLTWDVLAESFRTKFKAKEADIQTFIALMKDYKADETPEGITQVLSDVVAQLVFKCAAYALTTNFTKNPQRRAYFYQFDPRPKKSLLYPWAKKAIHMDEIPFVFGAPFVERENFTEKERQLSRTMMTYWSNFAKTGIPDVQWKPCQGKNMYHLWFKDLQNHEVIDGLPGNTCDSLLSLFPVKR